MARIRSLHPGQAVDEDFVEMSRDARLFTLHLRCEADDQGVFEWKPKRLKMAIFPADDDVDVEAILAELVENRQVQPFEVEGKRYGIIRNFRRWQRPKKPTSTHPLPEHLRKYAGLIEGDFPTGSEPNGDEWSAVSHQFPTGSEKSPQMKEEGGRRKKDTHGAFAPIAPAEPDPFEAFWAAYPQREGDNPKKPARAAYASAVKRGADPAHLLAAVQHLAAQHPRPTRFVPRTSTWLNEERYADLAATLTPQPVDHGRWQKRLEHARQHRSWALREWGPMPGSAGCLVPTNLIRNGDGDGWTPQREAA